MSHPKLTQERLKEILHYDPETGVWTWAKKRSGLVIGKIAGNINNLGYRVIEVCGKKYQSSRLAFLFMEGYFPEHQVDHINRIRNDDRWRNLRHVSPQCNTRNRRKPKNNTSGVVGVMRDKTRGLWIAYIYVNRKYIQIGRFQFFSEAVKARWEAEKKYKFPNCQIDSTAYKYLMKETANAMSSL